MSASRRCSTGSWAKSWPSSHPSPRPPATGSRASSTTRAARSSSSTRPASTARTKELNRFMVGEALGVIPEVEAALLVVDATTDRPGQAEETILRGLADARRPVVLAINKVDTVDKAALLPLLDPLERAPGAARHGADLRPARGPTSIACSASSGRCCPRGAALRPGHADRPEREVPGRRADSRAAVSRPAPGGALRGRDRDRRLGGTRGRRRRDLRRASSSSATASGRSCSARAGR